MVTLQAFSKAEDAAVFCSLLASQGIEAVLVDESSFGGNALGATPNSIRVDVPEAQVERAREILREEQAHQSEAEGAAPPIDVYESRSIFFNWLILCELSLFALTFLGPPRWCWILPPEHIQSYLDGQVLSKDLWMFSYSTTWGCFVISSLASILLYFRLSMARYLFLGCVLVYLFFYFCNPPGIPTSLGSFLAAIDWILCGVIITLMFTQPVAGEFRKRFTD